MRYEGEDTMTWGGMTALLCWGSADFQEETNAKGGWQGVRAKSSLYNILKKRIAVIRILVKQCCVQKLPQILRSQMKLILSIMAFPLPSFIM